MGWNLVSCRLVDITQSHDEFSLPATVQQATEYSSNVANNFFLATHLALAIQSRMIV